MAIFWFLPERLDFWTGYYSVFPFWDWVSENYKQVLVVPGNHEFYNLYDLSSMKEGLCCEI